MNLNLFDKEITLSKRKLGLIVVIPMLAIILGVFGFIKLQGKEQVFIGKNANISTAEVKEIISPPTESPKIENIEEPKNQDEIKIYIVGCVKKEGIVSLKKGQIVNDAVMLAGGLTKEADAQNINLAYILTENTMIKVKSKEETRKVSQENIKSQASNKTKDEGIGMEIIHNSDGAIMNEGIKEEKKDGKININTATLSELDTLPRVGEKTASDIISYREKVGGFKKLEDLMEVPRIGEKTFDNLKDLIDIK